MGKGDKKSKKGKRTKGSYGVTRNRRTIKSRLKRSAEKVSAEPAVAKETPAKTKRTVRKKSEA